MLAILVMAQFMALLDATIVNVAIPSIHANLHASGASWQLVIAGAGHRVVVAIHRRIFLNTQVFLAR